jgi:ATP-binding cassette, subfamily B, bacterial
MKKTKRVRIHADISDQAINLTYKLYLKTAFSDWKRLVPIMILPGLGNLFIFYISTIFFAQIVGKYPSVKTPSELLLPVLLFGASYLLGEMFMRIGQHINQTHQYHAMKRLYVKSLEDLLEQDMSFFADNFAGSLTKRAGQLAGGYETVMDKFSMNIFSIFITLTFSSIYLLRYSWLLSAWLVVMLIIGFIGGRRYILQRLVIIVERNRAKTKATGVLADIVSNISIVKSDSSEKSEIKNYSKAAHRAMDLTLKGWRHWNLKYDGFVTPVYILANMGGIGIACYIGIRKNLPLQSLVVTFAYFTRFTRSLWEVGPIYQQIENAVSDGAEHIDGIMNSPRVVNKLNAKDLAVQSGEIEFKDVSFSYLDNNKNSVISSLDLHIKPGQKIGLVGPSGGGKTTITKLLLRFMNVTTGSILIDGQNVDEVTQLSLRNAISYVSQEPLLFHRSISENIAYARPDSDKNEIRDAAKKANAHNFITSLNNGYDTTVGERGIKLSGGQKQRVAIARAILKNAPIVVLDEATSALDSESEKLIQDALFKLMEGRTAIVIAHRLSTIKHLDRILVLEDGKITDDGTHEELIAKKQGTYARLWSHQSGGFIE